MNDFVLVAKHANAAVRSGFRPIESLPRQCAAVPHQLTSGLRMRVIGVKTRASSSSKSCRCAEVPHSLPLDNLSELFKTRYFRFLRSGEFQWNIADRWP